MVEGIVDKNVDLIFKEVDIILEGIVEIIVDLISKGEVDIIVEKVLKGIVVFLRIFNIVVIKVDFEVFS